MGIPNQLHLSRSCSYQFSHIEISCHFPKHLIGGLLLWGVFCLFKNGICLICRFGYPPELRWQRRITCLIGDTSSNSCFSSVILVFGGVICRGFLFQTTCGRKKALAPEHVLQKVKKGVFTTSPSFLQL